MAGGDVYLGDSVYLEYLDNGDLTIYLSDGFKKTNIIYLEEEVCKTLLKELIQYLEGKNGKN